MIKLVDVKPPPSLEPYLVIEMPVVMLAPHFLTEGQWRPSNVGDLWYRVDPENPAIPLQRHVHISHKKHLTAAQMQVAWNQDHSRHDRHNFNTAFTGLSRAKQLARTVLGLPDDAVLEQHDRSLLTESIVLEVAGLAETLPEDAVFLVVKG